MNLPELAGSLGAPLGGDYKKVVGHGALAEWYSQAMKTSSDPVEGLVARPEDRDRTVQAGARAAPLSGKRGRGHPEIPLDSDAGLP